jgi:hypothetical protein
MKPSLKQELLSIFKSRYNEWIHVEHVSRQASNLGFMTSNVARRCRELVNEGKLEKELREMSGSKNKTVWYRYVPTAPQIAYRDYKKNKDFDKMMGDPLNQPLFNSSLI